MLTRLPATECKIARKLYTMTQKRTTVHLVESMVDAGNSISSACRIVKIKCSVFYQWRKVVRGESNSHLKKAWNSLAPPATATGIKLA